MLKKMSLFCVTLVTLLSYAGCNIKEDRSGCPCRLILDLSNVKIGGNDCLEIRAVSGTDVVCSEKIDSSSLGSEVVMYVPRTSLRLMALSGGEGMTDDDGLVIPLGRQCPQIYSWQSDVDAVGETCRDTVLMRKNHCVLSVVFRHGEDEPMTLSLRGEVCGYDRAGYPLEGQFLAAVEKDLSVVVGCPQVVLPRQQGGQLYLDVDDGDGHLKSFPLSEYMEAAGYDWSAPDLPDMIVTIDYVLTNISLIVDGWEEEFFFDVVI